MTVDDVKAVAEDVAVVVVVDSPEGGASGAEPAVVPPLSLFAKCRGLRRGQAVGVVLVYTTAMLLTAALGMYARRHPQLVSHGARVTLGQLTMMALCMAFILSGLLTYCRTGFCSLRGSAVTQARELAEFSAYLVLMAFLDRTDVVLRTEMNNKTRTFCLLMLLLFLVGLCTVSSIQTRYRQPSSTADTNARGDARSTREESEIALLNRTQTDEWRGWMQMAFVWFHYFSAETAAGEARTMVNAFVWMTGYGNFHYYRKTGNFGFERFCQTLWRLNMLTFCISTFVNTLEENLYFVRVITVFWLIVYGAMYLSYKSHFSPYVLAVEFVALYAFAYCLWDAPFSDRLFPLVWRPFFVLTRPLFGNAVNVYTNFKFWTLFYHYPWITGMLTAAGYDYLNSLFLRMDALPTRRKVFVKLSVVLLCLGVLRAYYAATYAMSDEQFYARFAALANIPIMLYIVLRNISATLRRRQLRFFVFLGKFSLEAYIAQWYLALPTTRKLHLGRGIMSWTGGRSQWADFAISTVLVTCVAHRLFVLTDRIREVVLPSKTTTRLRCANILFVAILCAFTCCVQGALFFMHK